MCDVDFVVFYVFRQEDDEDETKVLLSGKRFFLYLLKHFIHRENSIFFPVRRMVVVDHSKSNITRDVRIKRTKKCEKTQMDIF